MDNRLMAESVVKALMDMIQKSDVSNVVTASDLEPTIVNDAMATFSIQCVAPPANHYNNLSLRKGAKPEPMAEYQVIIVRKNYQDFEE